MNLQAYLENNQQGLYKVFKHGLENNNLSHAYLLNGPTSIPLLDIAIYLAKSLVCTNPSPLACDKCLECSRIDNRANIDFYIFDGSQGSIKKEQILDLEKAFSVTSNELSNKLIYIIHLAERMTIEAINSILKFLEEPKSNVFAIITTNQIDRVLPTIISRAQTINLKLVSTQKVLSECDDLGINRLDSELLVIKYNSAALIANQVSDKTYLKVKECLLSVIDAYINSLEQGVVTSNVLINSLLKDKIEYAFYLQLLQTFIKDIINYTYGNQIVLNSYLEKIIALSNNIKNPLNAFNIINQAINQIDLNVNIGLINDHINNHLR